jgi:hypothetical protein
MVTLTRRAFFTGAAALIAAPAIVRIENIMPLFVPKRRVLTLQQMYDDYLDKMVRPPLVGYGVWIGYEHIVHHGGGFTVTVIAPVGRARALV